MDTHTTYSKGIRDANCGAFLDFHIMEIHAILLGSSTRESFGGRYSLFQLYL